MEAREVNNLLGKYWEGETNLEEETQLKRYFNSGEVDASLVDLKPLFVYFKEATETNYAKNPSIYIQDETKVISIEKDAKTKVFDLRWLRAVAAIGLLMTAAFISFNHFQKTNSTDQQAYVQEIEDVDEAYEITKEALAFLSNKYNKGANPLATLPKSIESTRIFK